jgi:hypothetical protein
LSSKETIYKTRETSAKHFTHAHNRIKTIERRQSTIERLKDNVITYPLRSKHVQAQQDSSYSLAGCAQMWKSIFADRVLYTGRTRTIRVLQRDFPHLPGNNTEPAARSCACHISKAQLRGEAPYKKD